MAKRGAQSELNHDNWNEEEESEEAGVFAQADQETIKGRVIKKAKRRGITKTDGAPSIFAGFGGFSKTPSSDSGGAFDFLKKNGSSEKSSFGSSNFAFGSGANATKNDSATFSFGNGSSESKGLFAFGSGKPAEKTEEVFATKSIETEKSPEKTPIIDMFKPKDTVSEVSNDKSKDPFASVKFGDAAKENKPAQWTGSWGSNGADKDKPPAQQIPTMITNPIVMPKSNKWSCPVCMVPNDGDACVCCSEPRPGGAAKKVQEKPAEKSEEKAEEYSTEYLANLKALNIQVAKWIKNHVDKNPFVFLSPIFKDYEKHLKEIEAKNTKSNKSGDAPQLLGGVFGAKAAENVKFGSNSGFAVTDSGFKFENLKPAEENKSTGFAFGSTSAVKTDTDKSTGFKFGATKVDDDNKTTEKPTGFTFGSKSDDNKSTSFSSEKSSGFSFGSSDKTEAKSTGFSFGSSDKTETKSTGFSFGSDSKKDEKSTGFTFGSATKPEEKSSGFSFGSSTKPEEKSTGFSFGSTTKSDEKSSGFSFGSAPKSEEKSAGFSFGSSSSTEKSSTGFSFGSAPSSGFSFGAAAAAAAAKTEEKPSENNEETEDEPPKVEVKQVVEEDAFHSVRCKLFYKKEKEFIEKGLGMLHLKKVEGDKTQMVIRAETNLGNILLNILVSDKINVVKRKNNIQFGCVPNPPIKGIEGPAIMLVKVKDALMADQLEEKLNQAIES